MAWINRKHKFYAIPEQYPDWDEEKYPSRYGIGMNLKDFRGLNDEEYHIINGNKVYHISSEKAKRVALEIGHPPFPHVIPLEEFDYTQDLDEEN